MLKVKFITISWQQYKLFLECPACFYVVCVLREKRPGIDSEAFSLNRAVDEGMKADFDKYRQQQKPHPEMLRNNIEAVPLSHPLLKRWRSYKLGGVELKIDTLISLRGVIDDVWINSRGELIVVEYKGTSKSNINPLLLASDRYGHVNKQQLAFYSYLFRNNSCEVANEGYLVYGNAVRREVASEESLKFDIEYCFVKEELDLEAVEKTMEDLFICLLQRKMPSPSVECEHCKWRYKGELLYRNV